VHHARSSQVVMSLTRLTEGYSPVASACMQASTQHCLAALITCFVEAGTLDAAQFIASVDSLKCAAHTPETRTVAEALNGTPVATREQISADALPAHADAQASEAACRKKVEAAQAELESLARSAALASEELVESVKRRMDVQHDTMQATCDGQKLEVATLQSSNDRLRAELDDLTGKLDHIGAEANHKIDKANDRIRGVKQERDEMRQENEFFKSQQAQISSSLMAQDAEMGNLEQIGRERVPEISQLRARVAQLEAASRRWAQGLRSQRLQRRRFLKLLKPGRFPAPGVWSFRRHCSVATKQRQHYRRTLPVQKLARKVHQENTGVQRGGQTCPDASLAPLPAEAAARAAEQAVEEARMSRQQRRVLEIKLPKPLVDWQTGEYIGLNSNFSVSPAIFARVASRQLGEAVDAPWDEFIQVKLAGEDDELIVALFGADSAEAYARGKGQLLQQNFLPYQGSGGLKEMGLLPNMPGVDVRVDLGLSASARELQPPPTTTMYPGGSPPNPTGSVDAVHTFLVIVVENCTQTSCERRLMLVGCR